MTSSKAEISEGDVLDGKYRILRRIGAGGMGAVFSAKRMALDDTVAIKCILSAQNTDQNRTRFLREARAAARIRHPNVVQIFDFGDGGESPPYMVMEYLEGPTLSERLRRNKLPVARVMEIFAQICAAVEAGHRRGVVHRDLKPGNVILARSDDGRERVKVLDFGLARLTDSDSMALTSPGALLGTCNYMSPEQIEGQAGSAASDVFALGVMLYQMVTGALPFEGATQIASMLRIAEGKYTPPKEVDDQVPDTICEAIEAALRKDPTERPGSPEALAKLAGYALASDSSSPNLDPMGASQDASMIDEYSLSLEDGGDATLIQDSGSVASSGPADDVFVGRDSELEALREEYRNAQKGTTRIVLIDGEPGVGKTMVLDRFLIWARARAAAVFRGRFFAYEGDRPPPHETFLWMLSQAASHSGTRGPENSPGAKNSALELAQDRWQAFATLAKAFADRSGTRPLVLALDDLQWATALDLEFLTYLQRGRPVLVLATARATETRPDARTDLSRWLVKLGNQRVLTRVGLAPFSIDEVRQFLRASFGSVQIHPGDLRRMLKATGGNPYYLAELVRQLVADGQLVRGSAGWICGTLRDVELPETVATVVRGRMGSLSDDAREVLELACVVGEEFRFETLEAAAGRDEDELEELLEACVEGLLLTEKNLSPGSDYRFASSTVRSVLYGDLSKRKRKRMHKKVLAALEALYGADRERIGKVLCYHSHAVGDWDATLRWGLLAVDSVAGDDVDNAVASIERVREACDQLRAEGVAPPVKISARVDLHTGSLYVRLGRTEEARSMLERGADEAAAAGEDSLRAAVLLELAECYFALGELDAGARTARDALGAASDLGDEDLEFRGRILGARIDAYRQAYDEIPTLLEPVIAAKSRPGFNLRAAQALRELAYAQMRTGEFSASLEHTREAINLARRARDQLAEYRAISTQAACLCEIGATDRAIPMLEDALERARRLSLRRREGIELTNLAETFLLIGDLANALARSSEALAVLTEVEDRATEGDCRVIIGKILVARGERDEGIAMLERARDLCEQTGRKEYAGLATIDIGEAKLDAGETEEGLALLRTVREGFEKFRSVYLWQAELALARGAMSAGLRDEARRHAQAAARLVDAQRSPGHESESSSLSKSAAEVSRLLAELGAAP